MSSGSTPTPPHLEAHAAEAAAGSPPRHLSLDPVLEATAVRRLRFATQDVTEGLGVLEEVYNARNLRVSPDTPFAMAQAVTSVGALSIERVRLTGAPATAMTDGTGTVRIAHILSGGVEFTDTTPPAPARSPFLLPARPYTPRWENLDLLTTTLDLAAVAAHAVNLLGAEQFDLHFTGEKPVSAAMARYWCTTATHVHQDLLDNDEALASPLVRAEAFRSLATAALLAFPNTFLQARSEAETQEHAPRAVHRAIAYMEEHLEEDIDLACLAAATRISPRGLQAAFHRDLGTTPMAHLRTLRLAAAHHDLLAADPATGATVEKIAARWGFAHRGRFAAAYQHRYGHPPATTLRT